MAVVAHVIIPGITKEQYDQVRAEVGWLEEPPAGLSHVTWWEGADCHNLDAWESEEAFGSFRCGTPRARDGQGRRPGRTAGHFPSRP